MSRVSLAGVDALDGVHGGDGRERAAPAVAGLPRWLSPFFGRSEIVGQVAGRLADGQVQLLTLTGPGGVGKTRLAARAAEVAARTFPDGTHFIPLAPVVDPALVLPMIGRAVGVPEGADGPIVERVTRTLTGRRTLLILDNLEQVLEVGPTLARLLRDAPGLTVLATSRAPLRVEGEHELAIPPLALPRGSAVTTIEAPAEAVGFFLERVRAVRPAFELTPANTVTVHEIVRRLDGLPLALELAATRAKVLSPEGLLGQMERKLHVLTGGPRDRPERQRTMRDTIAWSYGLLEADLQAVFRRLAVFRGGFSLEDAEAVLGGMTLATAVAGSDILDCVAALVDHSLLMAEGDDDPNRFRMLETIREFGMEQLAATGEARAVQTSFAARWSALAATTWERSGELVELDRAVEPLARNLDNVLAALDWLEEHDPAGAAELAGELWWLWYQRGSIAEPLRRMRRLLALPKTEVPAGPRGRLLVMAGALAHFGGESVAGRRDLEAGLVSAREHHDDWAAGFAALALGIVAEDTGAFEAARGLLHEAAERLAAAGDLGAVAAAHFHLAVVAFGMGNLDAATAELDLSVGGPLGEAVRGAGWVLLLRGLVAEASGQSREALSYLKEAIGRFRASGHAPGVCEALAGVAVVASRSHKALAVRLWGAAQAEAERRGYEAHPPELTVYEAAMARTRAALGEAAFVAELTVGGGWDLDQAVEVALALDLGEHGASAPGPLAALSPRELEVLRLVARGWTNERIAEELFLSPRTINTHLTSVFRKLDVENRTEAVRVLTEAGGA